MRRVVVTGLGLVTPLGTNVQTSWKRIINSECGIISLRDVTLKDRNGNTISFADQPSQVAGIVRDGPGEDEFDSCKFLDRGDARRMARFSQFALAASFEALKDANWKPQDQDSKERTGVCIGSGIGSLDDVVTAAITHSVSGYKKANPLFIPRLLINMAAGHLTIKYGFQGPNHSASTACSAGAHSIGDAYRFIQCNDADVMVAGGSEACIHPVSMGGFAKAKALVTSYNDNPHRSSRPFDRDRAGFAIGEGSGMVVLEELEHANKRGAEIYCEIKGYGLSGDAHHMTAPPDDGRGAQLSMRRALRHAQLDPCQIDYVNAHATSTPLGDAAENNAIKSVFGERPDLAVSSTKGAIGHLLGAAGSVEAIFTVLAIKNGILPPTLNLENRSEGFPFNYVAHKAQRQPIQAALTNSFGFGGTNCTLCFTRYIQK